MSDPARLAQEDADYLKTRSLALERLTRQAAEAGGGAAHGRPCRRRQDRDQPAADAGLRGWSAGNWRSLMRLAASGLPLPLGAVRNQRSLLAVDNLVDVLAHLAGTTPPPDRSGAYCVADTEFLSTTEVLELLRTGMGKTRCLVPFPAGMIAGLLNAAGRRAIGNSLLGDMVVDAARLRQKFGWSPPLGSREAIIAAGAQFAAQSRGKRTAGRGVAA